MCDNTTVTAGGRESDARLSEPLFLFPTEAEAEPFRRLRPDAEIRVSGVGVVRTAVSVSRFLQLGYRNLVLAGIAGSYGDRLQRGDVVAVCEERLAGMPALYARSYRPTEGWEALDGLDVRAVSGGFGRSRTVSGGARDGFVAREGLCFRVVSELPQAVSNTVTSCGAPADGADIENMEGAVFFALCDEYGAASREIRAVSNRVGDPREEWDTESALRRLAETLNRLYGYEQD